ncbi:MAG: sulfatase, partial [Planctomycetota bacterium]
MRLLYLDIDTTRADHLGCYGYPRRTTPNLDKIADQGLRLDNCYVSDAPCLPSRASMFTGQFGIHSGVVGHGGTAADLRILGAEREFRCDSRQTSFIEALRKAGFYPVSFSPFAERHSAWWFYSGWREMYNTGRSGMENGEEVVPQALKWIEAHGKRDNWLLHINLWDPHTPYRAPADFGAPFANEPLAGWYTEELRRRQWDNFGPGSPQEPAGALGGAHHRGYPRVPFQIASMQDYKQWIDGYDCGILYADLWCGRVLDALARQGVLDETIVIVTSDHGEAQGELSVIGDHATADQSVSRVPMLIRWPGLTQPGAVDTALHYQTDVAATVIASAGGTVPAHWDGQSFPLALGAPASRRPAPEGSEGKGRDYLVVSQCAWSCQRAARWGDYIFIRSYHTGLKNYPARMLFDISADLVEL